MRYGRQDDGLGEEEEEAERERESEKVRKRSRAECGGEKRQIRSGLRTGKAKEKSGEHGLLAWAVRSVELAGFPGTEEEKRKEAEGKGQETEREQCHCGSQRRQAMRGTGVPVVFTLYVLTVLYWTVRVLQSHSPSVVFYPNYLFAGIRSGIPAASLFSLSLHDAFFRRLPVSPSPSLTDRRRVTYGFTGQPLIGPRAPSPSPTPAFAFLTVPYRTICSYRVGVPRPDVTYRYT